MQVEQRGGVVGMREQLEATVRRRIQQQQAVGELAGLDAVIAVQRGLEAQRGVGFGQRRAVRVQRREARRRELHDRRVLILHGR